MFIVQFVETQLRGDINWVVVCLWQVGGTFDVKERLFRDYGQLISSSMESITVTQHWQGGLSVNVTMVLIDPLGRIVDVHNITVPQGGDNIVVSKVHLTQAALPGRWEAMLIYQSVLVAKTSFLVLTDLYVGRTFKLPKPYAYDAYNLSISDIEKALYQRIIAEDPDAKYMLTGELQSKLSGGPNVMIDWVDALVEDFWKPNAACSLGEDDCDLVPACEETDWSTFSPDPKSELPTINPRTGKFSQPTGK